MEEEEEEEEESLDGWFIQRHLDFSAQVASQRKYGRENNSRLLEYILVSPSAGCPWTLR